MTNARSGRREWVADVPEEPWVMIFGGVTREGNRRARRAVSASIRKGWNVVWFDGFDERFDNGKGQRVPLDGAFGPEQISIYNYASDERRLFVNKWIDRTPTDARNRLPTAESTVLQEASRPDAKRPAQFRPQVAKGLSSFWLKVIQRSSQILRGYFGWRLTKSDVQHLAKSAASPEMIIYGDDFAQTQAWHACRLWTETRAGMVVPER